MKIRNLIPFKTSLLSAPINKFLGVALVMLVLLTSSVASAQLFPVQVSPQLTPPYSLKLSDYSTSTTEKLLVNLLLTDVNESDLQVRLRFSISGNSVNIQSKDFVQNAAPIQLTGGIPLRLSNLDLQPYFDLQNLDGITPSEYSKPLPDGLYQFCFEVFDWTTGRPLSEKKCYPVYLVLNDPPFLNLPQNGEQVPARDPQNIIFQWTPRHVNATGVEYEFELRELWDTNVDPQAAFLASPNLYQTTGFANTLLYGPGETSLLEGKTYGWRVRAVVSDGISETAVFKNGGYSEIFYFTYTGKCDAPQYILAKSEGTTTEEITWQQNPDHINYQIQFRKEGGSNNVWFESETEETKKKLFFLEAETTYEYRVGGQCVQNGGYSYSAINTFTTPGKEDANEYNCGIPPEIVITNQDPLQLLGVNDVFTAGDFPVTVKEVNGGNGNYTGWGFIVVPYLGDTQIRVTFNNIQINTDKQLTNGIVETEYDEEWGGMDDIANELDAIGDLAESASEIIASVFEVDNEENAPTPEYTDTEYSSTTNNTNNNSSNTSNNTNSNSNSSSNNNSNSTEGQNSNDSSNEANNENTNEDSDNNESSEEGVVIVYNGVDYNNNDIIEVPYDKNNSHYAFTLKNYPKDATFNWQVLKGGTDNTSAFVTNDTKYDNLGIDMKNVYLLDIVANYNNKNIKITIKRELEDFELVDIYAKPQGEDHKKRVAKTGEKLYLQKSSTPFVNEKRKVDFSIYIRPNLSQGDISSQDIVWYYEEPKQQSNLGKNYGKKDIHLNLTEQDTNYSVNVKAGKPNLVEKGIDIVWFDGREKSWSFMPPFISQLITKSFNDIEDNLELADKILPIGDIDFEIDDIKINGSQVNEEDINSRLYYLLEKENVSGGISVTSPDITIPIPVLEPLNRSGILKIGPYINFGFSISAEGGVERKKYIESTTYSKDESYFELKATGCINAGIGVELLVAKNLLDFNVDFKASACIAGSGNYNFESKNLIAEFYIPPVVLSGEIVIQTKGTLEFELVNWNESISITDKIPISKIEHTF
ncbi:hypothetical protein JM80_2285 [Cellulophaga sp. RHA_52]|uniref:hypothetical protein n=1 Tax=Cellulophaga sp. RHA_52 TaxID=1250036 RepID=UPI001198D872|nr:hypothetical protein [Cellulophaga sp. RHA_52]TVZ09754.1 hypothetical protein JM80_2285 [Cellulophaga sp. RHA_52]